MAHKYVKKHTAYSFSVIDSTIYWQLILFTQLRVLKDIITALKEQSNFPRLLMQANWNGRIHLFRPRKKKNCLFQHWGHLRNRSSVWVKMPSHCGSSKRSELADTQKAVHWFMVIIILCRAYITDPAETWYYRVSQEIRFKFETWFFGKGSNYIPG